MNRPLRRIAATLLLALLLAGCGVKGPLYLPGDAQPTPPPEQPEDEDLY